MNLQELAKSLEVKKHTFATKTSDQNGLILQVQHTIPSGSNQKIIRFMYGSFDRSGFLLAVADQFGNIFLIDFNKNELWGLPDVQSCTAIKFCEYVYQNTLIIGKSTGNLQMIWSQTGEVLGELIGHQYAVISVSFAPETICLTASQYEAIIWDLKTQVKVHVLNLEEGFTLKLITYMPVTYNILACFENDTIHIWKSNSFDALRQILPTLWNKKPLKCMAFTRNGRAMVFGGLSQYLTVFVLDTWTISRAILLPDTIYGVKQIEFIPQHFDGGANKILAMLTTKGFIYLYDMDKDEFIDLLEIGEETLRFECSFDGKLLVCILKSGEINVYNTSVYFLPSPRTEIRPTATTLEKKIVKRGSTQKLSFIRMQLKELLDRDKLLLILKEFKEYPAAHRIKIWSQLLELPNNSVQYNKFINNVSVQCFENLENICPSDSKGGMRNLKRLLSNLVVWSPFFGQVNYLPLFLFPMVKVFANDPIMCFEAACSIIVNWCQQWFDYYPLPPMNILAIIENIIVEHDLELITFLLDKGVTSEYYAWPLLHSAFSEVISSKNWCILWDHIISNAPGFMLMMAASYCCMQKAMLVKLETLEEFVFFFHNQNPIDIHKWIGKAYTFLNKTSEENQPGNYIKSFAKLEIGSYPEFLNYPKTSSDGEANRSSSQAQTYSSVLEQEDIFKMRGRGLEEKVIKVSEIDQKVKSSPRTRMTPNQTNIDTELLQRYSEILKHKIKLEVTETEDNEEKLVNVHQAKLTEELRNMKGNPNPSEHLKVLNIKAGLAAATSLIRKLKNELSQDSVTRIDKIQAGKPVTSIPKLEGQAKELQAELGRLLNVLGEDKSDDVEKRRVESWRIGTQKRKNQRSKP